MIEIIDILLLREHVPLDVIRDIRSLWPGTGSSVHLYGPSSDRIITEAMKRLSILGFQPQALPTRIEKGEYWCRRYRRFDECDLDNCEYLELHYLDNEHYYLINQHIEDSVVLGKTCLRHANQYDVMYVEHNRIICSDKARRILSTHAIDGVRFVPTQLGKFDRANNLQSIVEWPKYRSPWWELDSTYKLPPVSPSLLKTNGRHELVPNNYHGNTIIFEPPFADAVLRYRESELRAVGNFDIALTFEWRAEPRTNRRVVSRRFYDIWKCAGLQAVWRPVILEP